MRQHDSRLSDRRRSGLAISASAVAAALACHPTPPGAARAEATALAEPEATASMTRKAAHEIRITLTRPGHEGLELAARLQDGGGLVRVPIFWTVRRAGAETIFKGATPRAAMPAAPGDYLVTARYGTVTVARTVTLLEGQRLGIVFTLEVGGIRVLPRLAGLGAPTAGSETLIYARTGGQAGRLIARSTLPGEIIRVGSGVYRIETRFIPGNATAAADIVVKPGLLSAVDVDHAAGLVRFHLGRPVSGPVSWTVTDDRGRALPPIAGFSADVVLKPGRYVVTCAVDGGTVSSSFSIAAGETRAIPLTP